MERGNYPVCVHQIGNAIATSLTGTRPIPLAPGESAMRGVPVKIVLRSGLDLIEIEPCSWVLVPHMRATPADKELEPNKPGELGPEQEAALLFFARVPNGYSLVKDVETQPPEAIPELPVVPWTADTSGTLPELAHIDNGVFKANPELYNESVRKLNARGATGVLDPM